MSLPRALSLLATALLASPARGGYAQAEQPEPVVVEAEAWVRREPDDGSFARPAPFRWASGRRALLRFYGKGSCEYEIPVPAGGEWSLWLRYASGGAARLRSGWAGGARASEQRLPATGGFEGKRDWGWARLFRGHLAAGPRRYVLHAAGLRPDCLVLTQSAAEPDWMRPPEVPVRDAETEARIARPVAPSHPDWLDGAADYALPAWYDAARVCMHTRLPPQRLEDPIFSAAEEAFASLGTPTYVRHLKTRGEGAWWPSAVGPVEPFARERDVAREIIARAHAHGLRLIAYYRHLEDVGMAARHPEWCARDDRGEQVPGRREEPLLCLSTGYADYVLARLLELADRGVDGLYFDEVHMARDGCWCEACRAGFTRDTGLSHPPWRDEEDPLWQHLRDWTNLQIERTFLKWRAAIHARHPECVLVVSNNVAPSLMERQTTGRLWRISDAVKTEFDKGSSAGARAFLSRAGMRLPERGARLTLGFALCRDGADGRPPHVWIPRIETDTEACFALAGVVAHGGVANLDHPERTLPDPETFGAAIALGNRVAPALAGRRPWRWAAVHLPERGRERLATDPERTWHEILWPFVGAWTELLQARVPAGIVTDNQLAEGALEGVSVLVLPAPEHLDHAMQAAVRAFEEHGGTVLREKTPRHWHEPGPAGEAAAAAFRARLAPLAERSPVRVLGGPPHLSACVFRDPSGAKLTVTLVNDFSWVHTTGGASGSPPPPCQDVRLLLPAGARHAVEVVRGRPLEVQAREGRTEISVPPFEVLAAVTLELEPPGGR